MKKLLLLSGLAIALYACQSTSPKETAQQFISALAAADMTTAQSLVSTDTKAALDGADKNAKPAASPEEMFQLATLAETVNGNKAEVRNNILTLSLVKESDGWRVVLNESLLNDIQNREALLTEAKTKWEALQKEYEGRRKILNEYISYKKRSGELSPNVRRLNDALSSLPAANDWTGDKLLAYAQKQQDLNKAIDGALEPSMAANTDLSLTYFLQISHADDRIKEAEAAYQFVAQKAHSPQYRPLPFVTKSTPKMASN